MARANIGLRCAERVMVELGAFSARSLLPTGSAEAMYSSITAARSFFFLSLSFGKAPRLRSGSAIRFLFCWHSLLSSANLLQFLPLVKGVRERIPGFTESS